MRLLVERGAPRRAIARRARENLGVSTRGMYHDRGLITQKELAARGRPAAGLARTVGLGVGEVCERAVAMRGRLGEVCERASACGRAMGGF